MFVILCFACIHDVIQVFSRHAGDQLAAQPRGCNPPEDGCGCHLPSGGQGQHTAHLLCISLLQGNSNAPVSPTC